MRMRDVHLDLCNEAQDRIAEGESPDNMVRFVSGNPALGLSAGLPYDILLRNGAGRYHWMRLGDIAEGNLRIHSW